MHYVLITSHLLILIKYNVHDFIYDFAVSGLRIFMGSQYYYVYSLQIWVSEFIYSHTLTAYVNKYL